MLSRLQLRADVCVCDIRRCEVENDGAWKLPASSSALGFKPQGGGTCCAQNGLSQMDRGQQSPSATASRSSQMPSHAFCM